LAAPAHCAGSPATRRRRCAHLCKLQPTQDSLPTARLTRLASSLADQAPPVDVARVASLRAAIASGSYGVHPAIIASAMLDFHSGAE
jgi:negative regulator of flagellin synthesis FlgM